MTRSTRRSEPSVFADEFCDGRRAFKFQWKNEADRKDSSKREVFPGHGSVGNSVRLVVPDSDPVPDGRSRARGNPPDAGRRLPLSGERLAVVRAAVPDSIAPAASQNLGIPLSGPPSDSRNPVVGGSAARTDSFCGGFLFPDPVARGCSRPACLRTDSPGSRFLCEGHRRPFARRCPAPVHGVRHSRRLAQRAFRFVGTFVRYGPARPSSGDSADPCDTSERRALDGPGAPGRRGPVPGGTGSADGKKHVVVARVCQSGGGRPRGPSVLSWQRGAPDLSPLSHPVAFAFPALRNYSDFSGSGVPIAGRVASFCGCVPVFPGGVSGGRVRSTKSRERTGE